MAVALVTGVAGQDGVYLARSLRRSGVEVVGVVRPGSPTAVQRQVYLQGVHIEEADLCDTAAIRSVLERHQPLQVYNLAGFSSVGDSWNARALVRATNGDAVVSVLEAVSQVVPDARFLQASSAELLGSAAHSPYAEAKAQAQVAVTAHRDRGMFACSAVLYPHESPLRGHQFVTRKISSGVAAIARGRTQRLTLGNLDVRRDWGHARDYVEAMRAMLALPAPADLPIGTGVACSLTDLVSAAFAEVGIADARAHLVHDPALLRPADTPELVADVRETTATLGWSAERTAIEVIREMVRVDLVRLDTGIAEDAAYL